MNDAADQPSAVVSTGEIVGITYEAVVIRADGTREDLGVISEWQKGDPE